MTIKIYPSLMQGGALEEHEYAGSFGDWLKSAGVDFRSLEKQPLHVLVDEIEIGPDKWDDLRADNCDIHVHIIANGGVFKALGSILSTVLDPVMGLFTKGPVNTSSSNQRSGERIETVNATANQAKLGEVVPELAGRHIRYPDYLTPPHRFFENLRSQSIQFLACVGPGYYAVNRNDVKVGDTPFDTIGAGTRFDLHPPGADISWDAAHQHWHETEEVGGTSSGTPGLILSTDVGNRDNVDGPFYDFVGGDTILKPEGEYPNGWGSGTVVNVEYPRAYDVVNRTVSSESAPTYSISAITGYFGHLGNISVGMRVSFGPLASATDIFVSRRTTIGNGVYTLEFSDSAQQNENTGYIVIPAGIGLSLVFGARVNRMISFATATAITVSPGGFEPGEYELYGARVVFNSGGTVFGEWTPEFVVTPGNELTQELEFDVFFPGGLTELSDGGDLRNATVTIQFQYRDLDTNVRTTLSWTYTQATNDAIGFTEKVYLPFAIRAAARMRRLTPNSTKTSLQDKCHWYGMKARLWIKAVYPKWTTMGVSVRSGGLIAAQSENQVNLVATRQLPELQSDGSWGGNTATRHVSAFFRHVLRDIGYADSQIDMAELRRLSALWNARGETLDYVFDETTVKEALNLTLGAGMAELTISDGLVKPVRDDLRAQFEQGYSPQNMTGPLRRSFQSRKPGDPDGIEVEYIDGQTWTKQVVRCFLPSDQGFKIQKVKLNGVTDRTRAWRIGMRQRREMFYRRWEYSFGTELDALNSEYLSYVPLLDDTPGYGRSAILERLELVGGQTLWHVSEPMEWTEGESHVVAYRRLDGTLAGPFPAQPGPDDYTIVADIPGAWPVINLKAEPPHVYFGTATRWCYPALITEIRPDGGGNANAKAMNYHPAVYADDNNSPPA